MAIVTTHDSHCKMRENFIKWFWLSHQVKSIDWGGQKSIIHACCTVCQCISSSWVLIQLLGWNLWQKCDFSQYWNLVNNKTLPASLLNTSQNTNTKRKCVARLVYGIKINVVLVKRVPNWALVCKTGRVWHCCRGVSVPLPSPVRKQSPYGMGVVVQES